MVFKANFKTFEGSVTQITFYNQVLYFIKKLAFGRYIMCPQVFNVKDKNDISIYYGYERSVFS